MDFATLLWLSVAVVFSFIGAHMAGLDPLVRLGLKTRRPTSSRILAKPSPAINSFKSQDGTGGKKYNQEAGRLRVPQSPSNRPQRAVPNHVSTPIPPQRVGPVRQSPSMSPMEVNPYEEDHGGPMPSPRAPAYQLTRVASSPALSSGRWPHQPQGYQSYGEFEPAYQQPSGVSTENTVEYYLAGDGTPIYLETQIPPPYVDDLPERRQPSRRKRSESHLSYNDAGSEYGGVSMDDPFDAALASYPRSAIKDGRSSRKKFREMTDEDRLELGRESKISGKNPVKRRRHHLPTDFDDTRSETGSILGESRPNAKRPRLHESSSQVDPEEIDESDYFYEDDSMAVDADSSLHPGQDDLSFDDGEVWAVGPSQMRRRSSSNMSHYNAQEQRSMSKAKANQRSQHKNHISATGSKRKIRSSSNVDANGSEKEKLTKQSSSRLQHASSSLNGAAITASDENSMMVTDAGTHPSPPTTISAESSSRSLQSQGSSIGYGGLSQLPSHSTTAAASALPSASNSAAPSTNHSPTRPEMTNGGAFGIPIHSIAHASSNASYAAASSPQNGLTSPMPSLLSTPSSLSSSSRQARLQMLRDQSHTLSVTPTGPSSISRIPLTNSATKRALEPPSVAFTPVPSIPATPMPQSVETSPTKPDDASTSPIPLVSDSNEPDEDARISHILQSAHQRKEDKDMKHKEQEEKAKQASAFKLSQAAAASKLPTAATTATEGESQGEAAPPSATTPKPGFSAPKLGFKPPTAAPAAAASTSDASGAEQPTPAEKPVFKVPGSMPKVPSFGTTAKPTAASGGLFGAKPAASATPSAPPAAATESGPENPVVDAAPPAKPGGFRFGGTAAGATTGATTGAAPAATAATASPAAAPSTAPGAGLFKSPASLGSTATNAAPARPSFGASATASPVAPTTTGFGAKAGTTPGTGFGITSTPATAVAAPVASKPGAGLFGAQPNSAAPASGASTGFGIPKATGLSAAAPSPASTTTSFGAAKPGAGLFGAKPTAAASPAAPTTSAFGASSRPGFGATTTPSSTGMMTSPDKPSGFGQQTAGTGMGGFGQQSTGAATGFGAQTAPGSSFGAKPAAAGFGASSGATTGFGASSGTTTGFGAASNPSTPSRPGSHLFGGAAAPTASPASGFGASSKPANGFGASSGTGSSFGASSGASSTGFGANKPTGNAFGASSGTTTGFGAGTPGGAFGKPATSSTGFGGGNTNSNTGTTAFGAGGSTGGATAFGASSGASRPGAGLFGSTTTTTTTNSASPRLGSSQFGATSGSSSPAPGTTSFSSTPRRPRRR